MVDPGWIHGIGMTSQRTRERLFNRLQEAGIQDLRVLEILRRTPRHVFIDEALASRAYDDTALPIGFGQTISQPYMVARMTELLIERREPERVLEIGTGSGYQTAVLAQLVPFVYSIERIRGLLEQAKPRFRALKLYNIRTRFGDGAEGWPQYAPFDGIILTAAPSAIPTALLDQLALGGRLVAPVGSDGQQQLVLYERTEDGVAHRVLSNASFVPMLGGTL
ncbi:MAG TPA: protein-L-isoaspartate(D-aspartate) O-methyltransferase [Gammaproteobacteria bacterium]|nr:protein-L-isoaspartate(D-aspartate) O-methyltransferase [Gammaproteobacteria bacterium]